MTLEATADTVAAAGLVVVNGPEDEPTQWDAVDWRAAEEDWAAPFFPDT